MRNLFDQYSQPENRLTHALAVCLHEDRSLLRAFLTWIKVRSPVRAQKLSIVEQTLPGNPSDSEVEAERNGLPDIVVHDYDRWCLLIESKVMAALTEDQLRRHERTLSRRGFETIHRLALTKGGIRIPTGVIGVTWSELYEWLGEAGQRGAWAERLREYLRAAEVRLVQEQYLSEGTLTMFDGFPFSKSYPYTYGEAKRLLRLALDDLKKDRKLVALGIDPGASGRSAITGRDGRAVWDFLSLSDRPRRGSFTGYPHLTLAVTANDLEVSVTIPNGVTRSVRQRLVALDADRFSAINEQILQGARRLIARGAVIEACAVQRHYVSQRSAASIDATLRFRLETSQSRGGGRVKCQPQWVALFAALPSQKRSNIQFQYVVHLPWGTKGLASRESLSLIVESWRALKPLLDALRGVE